MLIMRTSICPKYPSRSRGENICISNQYSEKTKALVATEFNIISDWFCISVGLAIMLKIMWWPSITDEWITLSCNWQTQEEIQELPAYAYIMIKTLTAENDEPRMMEFSYLFHEIETRLCQQQSSQ